jgi:hypothetical protein
MAQSRAGCTGTLGGRGGSSPLCRDGEDCLPETFVEWVTDATRAGVNLIAEMIASRCSSDDRDVLRRQQEELECELDELRTSRIECPFTTERGGIREQR